MKIVLTNDDGIDEPGLAALYDALKGCGELRVVAPCRPQSGTGHSVTTRSPLAVREVSPDWFSVDGTPADCTRIALKSLFPDADWIVAGINPGANLGSDVYQSGTVAAAREAAILGCRAMAVSQYIARDHTVDWAVTGRHAGEILQMLLARYLVPGRFWNVNLPHPLPESGLVPWADCGIDPLPHKFDFRREASLYVYEGTIHDRPQTPGKDVAVCFGGRVSISLLGIDCGAG